MNDTIFPALFADVGDRFANESPAYYDGFTINKCTSERTFAGQLWSTYSNEMHTLIPHYHSYCSFVGARIE